MNMNRILLVFILFFLFSCKNHYNEMIEWTTTIPIGVSADSVKQLQPDYLEIDWNNPEKYADETRYIITGIKNDDDLLQMENYLSFVNDKYQGRFAHK